MRIHFNGSPRSTVGVEVELQIIDPETKNLVSVAPRILERVKDSTHVKPELIEPVAKRLGRHAELLRVHPMMSTGPSYNRQ